MAVKLRTGCLLIITFMFLSAMLESVASGQPFPSGISVTDSVIPIHDHKVAFGEISIENFSDQTITVRNIGQNDLHIFQIEATDSLSAPFIMQEDNCTDMDLAFNTSCELTVRFDPVSTGLSEDSFDILSNDPDTPTVIVMVNGTGSGIPVPDITVTDPDIAFGQVSLGSPSERTVTIENTGGANLQIFDIALADTLDSPFSFVNDNCSNEMIAPFGTCEFIVRFEPVTLGQFNDSFDIPSDDPDDDIVTVTVRGDASINNQPTIPQLVYPAADQSCTRTSETFIWDKSIDPDGDAVTYTLEICRDITFTTGCITEANIIAQTQKQTYYAGTGTWFFMFGIILAGSFARKNRIVLLLAIVIITTSFLLIACGGGGGGDGGSCNPPAVPNVDQATQISRTVNGLSSNTAYFWKVKAEDGRGGLINSNVKSFTTQ